MLQLFFQAILEGIADLMWTADLMIGTLLEAFGFMALLAGLILGAWCIDLLIRASVRRIACPQSRRKGRWR